ncbi:MAG TPA: DUF4157 domain-containing protein [Bradyrhizobium sp.]
MPAVAQRRARWDTGAVFGRTAKSPPATAPSANATGLPDRLKSGVETLSGLGMDDVRVHYNSQAPARLQALAYTQGADIHIGPGQERHLPHEAWHVVQQKQGRVQATLQLKGAAINDDGGLEREADAMGRQALQSPAGALPRSHAQPFAPTNAPIQRRVGFEFESNIGVGTLSRQAPLLPPKQAFYAGTKWHVEPDRDHMEFVTQPLTTSKDVFATMDEIVAWVTDLLSVPIQLPLAEISGIREAAKKESEREDLLSMESSAVTSMLQQEAEFDEVVRSLGAPKKTVEGWIKTYGALAVNNVALAAESHKGKDLNSVIADEARSLKITPQFEFRQQEATLTQHRAFRRLDEKKIKTGMKPGLGALGNVQQVTAAPQATAGVTLDKLIDAMYLMPTEEVMTGINTPQQATRTLSDGSPEDGALLIDARKRAVDTIKPLRSKVKAGEKEWRELEGVVALVISYIRKGNQSRDVAFEDAKLIAPLMSRVNFSVMYGALAPPLQGLFQSTMIAEAAGYPANTRVFGDKGFGTKGKGPTIEEWVVSIVKGYDWLSLVGKQDVVTDKKSGSPSMGEYAALDKTDKLAPQGLVPLELRRIPKKIPLADWTMLAYQIFIMAEAMLKAKLY